MATFFDKTSAKRLSTDGAQDSGKAERTNQQIEQLQQQLKEKGEEIRAICDKLMAAGAGDEIPDDFLDQLVY